MISRVALLQPLHVQAHVVRSLNTAECTRTLRCASSQSCNLFNHRFHYPVCASCITPQTRRNATNKSLRQVRVCAHTSFLLLEASQHRMPDYKLMSVKESHPRALHSTVMMPTSLHAYNLHLNVCLSHLCIIHISEPKCALSVAHSQGAKVLGCQP